jgi:feruloyl esterase
MKNSNAGNNVVHALEDWVEDGKAPGVITATKYAEDADHHADPHQPPRADPHKILMTRPLCPYPQQAHYKGKGSKKSAASFECQ